MVKGALAAQEKRASDAYDRDRKDRDRKDRGCSGIDWSFSHREVTILQAMIDYCTIFFLPF